MNKQKIEALWTVIYHRANEAVNAARKIDEDGEAKARKDRDEYVAKQIVPALLKLSEFASMAKALEKLGCKTAFLPPTVGGTQVSVMMTFKGPNNEGHIPNGHVSKVVDVPEEQRKALEAIKYTPKAPHLHRLELRREVDLLVAEAQLSDDHLLDKVDELVKKLLERLKLGS